MPEETFETNLLRVIAAELYFLVGMTAAREMYGKSYFALGVAEKTLTDQAVLGTVGNYYQTVTPEWLRGTVRAISGFQGPTPVPPSALGKTEKP